MAVEPPHTDTGGDVKNDVFHRSRSFFIQEQFTNDGHFFAPPIFLQKSLHPLEFADHFSDPRETPLGFNITLLQ